MALTGALVVGPDRRGRSVAIVDGRVVAAAPAGARAPRLRRRRDRAGRGLRPHPPLQRPRALRHAAARSAAAKLSARFCKGSGGGSTARSTPKASTPPRATIVARALLAGTTTLVDHHESPNLIEGSLPILAEACARARHPGAALLRRDRAQFRPRRGAARPGGMSPRRRPRRSSAAWSGCTPSFTVSDETIREAGALARELGTVVHVHVAEDAADVDDARRRGYAGPLERLLALDALPAGSILAHGVHLSRDQVRRAADAGCWFVHNPRSNEGNRVGYAVAPCRRRSASRWASTAGTPTWRAEEAALKRLADAERRRGRRADGCRRPRAGGGTFRRRSRAAGARARSATAWCGATGGSLTSSSAAASSSRRRAGDRRFRADRGEGARRGGAPVVAHGGRSDPPLRTSVRRAHRRAAQSDSAQSPSLHLRGRGLG